MADINLDPSFGTRATSVGGDILETLKNRRKWVKNRDKKWNYEKYAYFFLRGVDPVALSDANDNDSVCVILQQNLVGTIGKSYSGGFLTAFHHSTSDIRTLKPSLTSATISTMGGDNLFDAYISEVDVKFTVYTQTDLDNVEKTFFLPGAKAIVEYGWAGDSTDINLRGKTEIRITNFGFTMNSDGSFNCFIKGLTPGFFIAQQPISTVVTNLTIPQQNAMGEKSAAEPTLPQALLAIAVELFGMPPEGDVGGTTFTDKSGKLYCKATTAPYIMNLQQGFWRHPVDDAYSYWALDYVIKPTYYISFDNLIKFIALQIHGSLSAAVRANQFSFSPTKCEIKPPMPRGFYGSADPRRYIFPGPMAYYGQLRPMHDANLRCIEGNGAMGRWYMQNILISISTFGEVYKKVFEESIKINDKSTAPKLVTVLRKLGDDMGRLSGGLVNIQILKSDDDPNQYIIFNETVAETQISHPKPETFSVLNESSIVKDVSLDSDFDVDKMLGLTIGNVKSGETSLAPIKTLYTHTTTLPTVQSNVKTRMSTISSISDLVPAGCAKWTIVTEGVHEEKVQSTADLMKKQLVYESEQALAVGDPPIGTQTTLPFNLKLGITLDGIENIGFMEPVSIDRLPATYKNEKGVRFLVEGLQHTFDGNGGWTTKIDTVMKIGKVQ